MAGRPIVVDCDTGIDDSLALLYLLGSADADVLAITCCSGNVEAHQVAQNNLALLELVGRDDIEVALGRTTPSFGRSRSRPRPMAPGESATPSYPWPGARSPLGTPPT